MYPKITIGIVLFGTDFLRESLISLIEQDYPSRKVEFFLRDHSPKSEAKKFIKKELPKVYKKAKIFTGKNLFHSGGHNFLINKSSGEYYICASQDMLYSKDFLSEAIKELEKPKNKKYGSAAIKLRIWKNPPQPCLPAGRSPFFKWGSEALSSYLKKSQQGRGILDSCGIGITRAHKFFDIGQGEIDKGQPARRSLGEGGYDKQKEIFGPSAALAIYRKSALEDIKTNGEYFDELLHYKNDVDLAYRLQWAGHKCLFLPKIVCWHDRGLGGLRKRRKRSRFEKENSFFGQRAVILKNFSPNFSLRTKLATKLRNLLTIIYSAIFESVETRLIASLRKELRKKSKAIKKRVKASEIEKYMNL